MENNSDNEKELVCTILGMEFYASPERATRLRADLKDLLMSKLTPEELKSVKIKPAFDCTPTFTKIKDKLFNVEEK